MKRRIVNAITLSVLFILLSISVVYAAFKMTVSYDAEEDYHEITEVNMTPKSQSYNLTFNAPGARVKLDYNLVYTAPTPKPVPSGEKPSPIKSYEYNYSLSGDGQYNPLYDMIYVYQNGEFLGILSDYLTYSRELGNGNPYYNEGKAFEYSSYIFPGETRNDLIELELHNASVVHNTLATKLTLNCHVKTANYKNKLFVGTEEEFMKSLDDLNFKAPASEEDRKTIVLKNNLTITGSYNIENTSNIDLCGHTLTLEKPINIGGANKDCDVLIFDSRKNGSITGASNLKLINNQALITPMVDLTGCLIEANKFNTTLLGTRLLERLDNENISNNGSYDLLGYFKIYTAGGLIVNADGVSVPNGAYTAPASISVIKLDYQVGASIAARDLKVVGSSETIYNEFVSKHLAHLNKFISTENKEQVLHDIYLPTSFKDYNATISWHSNKSNVLDNHGKLGNDQGLVTLTGTLKLLGKTYILKYQIYATKQDNLSKLKYLAGAVKIEFTHLYKDVTPVPLGSEFFLPTANKETDDHYYTTFTDGKDLQLTDISYELDSVYNYLDYKTTTATKTGNTILPGESINSAVLRLMKLTLDKTAKIRILGKFEDDPEVYKAYIHLTINLDSSEVDELVFAEAQDYLNSINVLQNILNTRDTLGISKESGDFELLHHSNGVDLVFAPDELSAGIYEVVDGWVRFKDYTKFKLTDSFLNIQCQMQVNGTNVSEPRTLYFKIPAVISASSVAALGQDFLADKAIFATIKFQTLMQRNDGYKFDNGLLLKDVTSNQIQGLPEYILMDDALQVTTLVFEYGSSDLVIDSYDLTILASLLDWAQGSTVTGLSADIKTHLNSKLDWVESDGKAELSDAEIAIISEYLERFPALSYWNESIKVLDNVLSLDDINAIKSVLITDPMFIDILNWIEREYSEKLIAALIKIPLPEAEIKNIVDNEYRETLTTNHSTVDSMKDTDLNTQIDKNYPAYLEREIEKDQTELNIHMVAKYKKENPNDNSTDAEILQKLTPEQITIYKASFIEKKKTEAKDQKLVPKRKFVKNILIENDFVASTYDYRYKAYVNKHYPTVIADSKLPDFLLYQLNNGTKEISNMEERAILYYVTEKYYTSDKTKYDKFISKWNETVKRRDITIAQDATSNVKEIRGIEQVTTKDTGTTTYTHYDYILKGILDWLQYYQLDDGKGKFEQLSKYVETSLVDTTKNNHFSSAGVGIYINKPRVSLDEWNLLDNYLKTYYNAYEIPSYKTLSDSISSTFKNKRETGGYCHYTDGLLTGFEVTELAPKTYKVIFEDVVNKRWGNIQSQQDFISANADFNKLVSWAMDTKALTLGFDSNNIPNSSWKTVSLAGTYTLADLDDFMVKDGLDTISYQEYEVLYTFFKQEVAAKINPSLNPTLRSEILSHYWSGYNENPNTEDRGALNLDFDIDGNVLNAAEKNGIIDTISPMKNLDDIIKNITNQGTSKPAGGDYFDNLTTISKAELEKLVAEYKNNTQYLDILRKAITTYIIAPDGTVTEDPSVTRAIDKQTLIDELKKVLGTANSTGSQEQNYWYLPIGQISVANKAQGPGPVIDQLATVGMIKNFSNLVNLTFRGNKYYDLFTSSDAAAVAFGLSITITNLKSFTMDYCKLNKLDGIEGLINVTKLSFKGNTDNITGDGTNQKYLQSLAPILSLIDAKNEANNANPNSVEMLSYLNVCDIDMKLNPEHLVLNKIYQLNGDVEIYYTYNNINTKFTPKFINTDPNFNNYVNALELASLLHEITMLSSDRLYLPAIIYNGSITGIVSWSITENDGSASIYNGKLYANKPKGNIVVSATVVVDGAPSIASATRYFVVQINRVL